MNLTVKGYISFQFQVQNNIELLVKIKNSSEAQSSNLGLSDLNLYNWGINLSSSLIENMGGQFSETFQATHFEFTLPIEFKPED